MPWFGPTALLGLLYTIIVMFAAQVRVGPSLQPLPRHCLATEAGVHC